MPALILMYHDLAGKEEGLECVPAGHRPYVLESLAFRLQVRTVAALGLPVLTVSQWAMGPRPERAVLLTFDDGHVSNRDLALTILQEYGLKATFYVTAGAIDRRLNYELVTDSRFP
ncbi:MAG: polysaccharide deacetylase family protein [Nitrospirota bacterium]